jgi:hypothetical protein
MSLRLDGNAVFMLVIFHYLYNAEVNQLKPAGIVLPLLIHIRSNIAIRPVAKAI